MTATQAGALQVFNQRSCAVALSSLRETLFVCYVTLYQGHKQGWRLDFVGSQARELPSTDTAPCGCPPSSVAPAGGGGEGKGLE